MLREDDNGKIVHELIPLSGSVAELITLTKQDFDDASAIGDDFGLLNIAYQNILCMVTTTLIRSGVD